MKVKLVFDDWRQNGKSVYNDNIGNTLSDGDFHSGTTFTAEIELSNDQEHDLFVALVAGYQPVFYAVKM